jgi:hypothetical protein
MVWRRVQYRWEMTNGFIHVFGIISQPLFYEHSQLAFLEQEFKAMTV